MFIKEELIKDRITLFFDVSSREQLFLKQDEYIQLNKKNIIIYKIRYKQLCLRYDIKLISNFFDMLPSKYQNLLRLKYEQCYSLSKIALTLSISKSGIITMNNKMIQCLTKLMFCDVHNLFIKDTSYDMLLVSLNLLFILQNKIKAEIKYLLRNNIYVDVSYDYLKSLYKKDKKLMAVQKIVDEEINGMDNSEKDILLYKINNPFEHISNISHRYNIPEGKIKKLLYRFRDNIIEQINHL